MNSFDLNDGSEGDDIGHWVELFTTLAVLCPGTSADIPLLDMYVLNCSKSSYLFLLLGTDESVLLRRVNKSTVFANNLSLTAFITKLTDNIFLYNSA